MPFISSWWTRPARHNQPAGHKQPASILARAERVAYITAVETQALQFLLVSVLLSGFRAYFKPWLSASWQQILIGLVSIALASTLFWLTAFVLESVRAARENPARQRHYL